MQRPHHGVYIKRQFFVHAVLRILKRIKVETRVGRFHLTVNFGCFNYKSNAILFVIFVLLPLGEFKMNI